MKYAIVALTLFLAACSTEQRAIAVAVADAAATQADFNAKAKQWAWCQTLTSGSEKRVYGLSGAKRDARTVICWSDLILDVKTTPVHHEHPPDVPVFR